LEKVVIPQLHTIFIALHDADRFSQQRSSFNVFGVGYRSPKLILTAILTFDFDQPHRTARAVAEKLKRFGWQRRNATRRGQSGVSA